MARDRFDDENDDDRNRRLGGDRDDDYDDEPRRGSGDVARAKAKAGLPGTLLMVLGILALAVSLPSFVLGIVNPRLIAEQTTNGLLIPMAEMQPPSPDRDKAVQQLRDNLRDNGDKVSPLGVASSLLGLACCAAMAFGGLQMRSLKGYTPAILGSVAALLPLQCFCCLSFPVGVWALITLFNSDVKAGFSAAARGAGRA